MKIVVVTESPNQVSLRADNTLIRDESNYYLPPFVKAVKLAVAFAVKVERSAKYVERQFANRYLSNYSPALLIYPILSEEAKSNSYKREVVNTLDNTTRIPPKLLPIDLFNNSPLQLFVDDRVTIVGREIESLKEKAEEELVKLSQLLTLKVGDMILLQVGESNELFERGELVFKEGDRVILSLLLK